MESLTTKFINEVYEPYVNFLKGKYRIHETFYPFKKIWEEKLQVSDLIKGPYLEKSIVYKAGCNLSDIPLQEESKRAVKELLKGKGLYFHQEQAINQILKNKNILVATGTSSGKTLCYQIPILDDLIKNPEPGLRAIIIYPLNALVNDQLNEWEQTLKQNPSILFARFTGQTPNSKREYEIGLKESILKDLMDRGLSQQELQSLVQKEFEEKLRSNPVNRLNYRDEIRTKKPQILITNFSMLEYLLERPIDSSIFKNAHLNFIVLDEVHAYRGVQATEIGFLIRRLKSRLKVDNVISIATSATIGKRNDLESAAKVRKFISELFDAEFEDFNPIYGESSDPELTQPSISLKPEDYIKIRSILSDSKENFVTRLQTITGQKFIGLEDLLIHDEKLFQLKKNILKKPILLDHAAAELWPSYPLPDARLALESLLEIVAAAKAGGAAEDMLPTRLHYFVKAQDGLHICLNPKCNGRESGIPALFLSRKPNDNFPEGDCPFCYSIGVKSKIFEVVGCRKCGYIFGALQDLGPRRSQILEDEGIPKAQFDSFSPDLGWAGDSFWTYYSLQPELPYPIQPSEDDLEEDEPDLILNPIFIDLCVSCGKKYDLGSGDNCFCKTPIIRSIQVFHRQCPADKYSNLEKQTKKVIDRCPNCGAKNASGLEPLKRFQESDDEMGLAMAIPLSHFRLNQKNRSYKKLLCFTDHRQRAAAFPSLLEEETFTWDFGRKIVQLLNNQPDKNSIDFILLGEKLAEVADPSSEIYDKSFFLPISREPDETISSKERRDLWIAEVFSYFGIPDSARESAEDLGLVRVNYRISETVVNEIYEILRSYLRKNEVEDLLQILFLFMRQKKAFTLPKGRVSADSPAFGRVTVEIGYAINRARRNNVIGWLPKINKNGGFRHNQITDYLSRALNIPDKEIFHIAEQIWNTFVHWNVFSEKRSLYQLYYENLFLSLNEFCLVCDRCGTPTAYSVRSTCPKKKCTGTLIQCPRNMHDQDIIYRWVSSDPSLSFSSLRSEEHTAQINKDLAKRIEDRFRADEGVNLLSSTTTFEMGINIGDLQKVLLRNAPPTSASYIQRVGRAGRGNDKNSIAVTLCRRTKYDADIWKDPSRLMSGEIRPATVFTKNRIISKRHFNAIVFARFLREKVIDENILGKVEQEIRIEPFLNYSFRENIPESWCKIQPRTIFLDFVSWINDCDRFEVSELDFANFFLGDIEIAKGEMIVCYQGIMRNIGLELVSLFEERRKLQDLGSDPQATDMANAIKALLATGIISVLAKRGFLPRYAFPLDVVTLVTSVSRWSNDADVELSRDRGIAIAEFSPGCQVIARKKVYTSAGIYIVGVADKPSVRWYSKCEECKQIRTDPLKDNLVGQCEVCGADIVECFVNPFIEPEAFSVRIEKGYDGSSRFRKSSLIRQRQNITHFIDKVHDSEFTSNSGFLLALKEKGQLFRYNLGPGGKGFMLCLDCGCSEPLINYKSGRKHYRLRSIQGKMDCANTNPITNKIAFAHQFESYCLVIRPQSFSASIESLSYALQKGLCKTLEIDDSDIGVSWRRLEKSSSISKTEIVLYDKAPGGAGFTKEAFENWHSIINEAYKLCKNCTCEMSCYDCLKDYQNQIFHDSLDRKEAINSLCNYVEGIVI